LIELLLNVTLNIGKRLTEDGEELKQNNPYNNSKDEGEEDYVAEHLEPFDSKCLGITISLEFSGILPSTSFNPQSFNASLSNAIKYK